MTPFLQDPDVTLYQGDALETLRQLPDGCVDMVATSPPFYGLRDYGSDGQIGLEETPDQWVANLVAVFRECRRVLADHGTLWVEIGDSYTSSGNGGDTKTGFNARYFGTKSEPGKQGAPEGQVRHIRPGKPKDLLGQPWMLAFALRADGWYLRSEIIWARPNPMPESVTDRPTKAHSTVFLLSKQPRYFYDADAIREPLAASTASDKRQINGVEPTRGGVARRSDDIQGWKGGTLLAGDNGANARSVWTIPTEPTPFAHFATWPRKLVARMVQAGTSERGKCPECGKPLERDLETTGGTSGSWHSHDDDLGRGQRGDNGNAASEGWRTYQRQTTGWSPSCGCIEHSLWCLATQRVGSGIGDCDNDCPPPPPVPCVVLDPFAGSGTTLLTARHHGRHSIGIELNPDYCALAASRLAQLSLLTG